MGPLPRVAGTNLALGAETAISHAVAGLGARAAVLADLANAVAARVDVGRLEPGDERSVRDSVERAALVGRAAVGAGADVVLRRAVDAQSDGLAVDGAGPDARDARIPRRVVDADEDAFVGEE